MNNIKLSKNFYLSNFLVYPMKSRVIPGPQIIDNMRRIAKDFLEPLKQLINGSLIIVRGYLPYHVFDVVEPDIYSMHTNANEIDIRSDVLEVHELAKLILGNDFKFKKMILDYSRMCIHVSFDWFKQETPVIEIVYPDKSLGNLASLLVYKSFIESFSGDLSEVRAKNKSKALL